MLTSAEMYGKTSNDMGCFDKNTFFNKKYLFHEKLQYYKINPNNGMFLKGEFFPRMKPSPHSTPEPCRRK